MTTAGIVEHRPQDNTFRLPPEHAASLTRQAAPGNIAAFAQYIAVLGAVEDEVLEAFRHGRGVPYSSYKRFQEVMAEDSGQTVVAALGEHILPLVPGLTERLSQGMDVLDVGCGSGRALLHLAEHFPGSRFLGLDISQEGIAAAEREAWRRNLDGVMHFAAGKQRLLP
jgi:SAM-dependent methyltransferase